MVLRQELRRWIAATICVATLSACKSSGNGASDSNAVPPEVSATPDPSAPVLATDNCDQAKAHPVLKDRPDSAKFTLALCDDFLGDNLDTSKWSFNYNWGRSDLIIADLEKPSSRMHNFNSMFDEKLVVVSEGKVRLDSRNEPYPTARTKDADGKETLKGMPAQFCKQLKKGVAADCTLAYTSSAITSRFRYAYGYIEGRIRMPGTHGFWPAFWMLHKGWPPEIDILELLTNVAPDGKFAYSLSSGYHYTKDKKHNSLYKDLKAADWTKLGLCKNPAGGCGVDLATDYHVWGMEWTPKKLRYYIDGQFVQEFNQEAFITAEPGYLLLNLGIGGWAENPDKRTDWSKGHMDIDWVRIWEMPGVKTTLVLPKP